ncbi:hypothetical protein [Acinetobacter sp. YH16032]|uniref:hypothetical protein n=1 Tax=Acinetobacter sp. YH16032 TaxID=2601181 RepID=UPI0015D18893|nr:hypothetical protein [Acinetobacter sp. YH16032]
MSVEEELMNDQDVMIQLPWTVPQQPLYMTNILVDPKTQKIPLNIQHSTDTTAISSFALSVIIALILGGLATWLAYWYGRKSFQLTEMSFKTVVEEIKASQQSAMDLNARLFEQQQVLQAEKEKFEREKSVTDRFRNAAEMFIVDIELFLSSVTLLHLSHIQFQFSEQVEIGSYEHEVTAGINKKFDQLFESRSKLLFSALEMEENTYDDIDQAISETIKLAASVKNRLVRGREGLMGDIEKCKRAINQNKWMFKKILAKKAA